MDSKPYQPTIDVSLIERLPSELKYAIKTLTFIAQMQAAYSTNDLEEMARRVCNYPGFEPSSDAVDGKTIVCWLTALLDLGIRIPDPPIDRSDLSGAYWPEYSGWTVFHCAAMVGDIPLIRRLVRLGYNINAIESTGRTTIHDVGTHIGDSNYCDGRADTSVLVLRTLCEEGADVNFSADEDEAPNILYHLILSFGTHDIATLPAYMAALNLLLQYGASPSLALHAVAERKSYLPFVKVILNAGANIEELWENMTPLTRAAAMKNIDVLQELLDSGADANGPGEPALFAAVLDDKFHYGDVANMAAIVTALCNAGADTTMQADGAHSIISYVLTHSAYYSAVQSTLRYDMPSVVEALCRRGLDVNFPHRRVPFAEVNDGDTPLHIATRLAVVLSDDLGTLSPDLSRCVDILVSHGADVNRQNSGGLTPLRIAVFERKHSLALFLRQHGARLDEGEAGHQQEERSVIRRISEEIPFVDLDLPS